VIIHANVQIIEIDEGNSGWLDNRLFFHDQRDLNIITTKAEYTSGVPKLNSNAATGSK